MTDRDKATIKLKVAEADQRDVGKGIVRIDESFREKLGLKPFDVVEIRGEKVTSVLIGRPYSSDEGLDIIRMDGLIRTNAKTSIGEIRGNLQSRMERSKTCNYISCNERHADLRS